MWPNEIWREHTRSDSVALTGVAATLLTGEPFMSSVTFLLHLAFDNTAVDKQRPLHSKMFLIYPALS